MAREVCQTSWSDYNPSRRFVLSLSLDAFTPAPSFEDPPLFDSLLRLTYALYHACQKKLGSKVLSRVYLEPYNLQ